MAARSGQAAAAAVDKPLLLLLLLDHSRTRRMMKLKLLQRAEVMGMERPRRDAGTGSAWRWWGCGPDCGWCSWWWWPAVCPPRAPRHVAPPGTT